MIDGYLNLLKELQFRYEKKYNVKLDDEILYIIIRINELQVDLKKDIKNNPPIIFPKSVDYFFYGLGKTVNYLVAGTGLTLLGLMVSHTWHPAGNVRILEKEGKVSVRMHAETSSGEDTLVEFPLK
jgi:hypothetical protein